MKAYLFQTNCDNYLSHWLLELKQPHQSNVLVTVYQVSDYELFSTLEQGVEHTFNANYEDLDSDEHLYVNTEFYLSVDVWEKYHFPKFAHDCQWYDVGDAEAIYLLIKEAVRLAADKAGVVLSSR